MNSVERNKHAWSLVRRAVLAPSSHNTQPWVFRIGVSEIDLFADRTRALPVNDPEDRELTISCGAALMNLRVAAAALGIRVQVQRLPDAAEPDWLARVTLSRDSGEPGTEGTLVEFIEARRTYRKRFSDREVSPATVDRLVDAAVVEGAWLRPLLTEETRQHASALVAEGDAAQWADPSWRRELAAWMHPRRRGDGLTVPMLAAPIAPQAGEALQHVLLVGCQLSLQASYLNHQARSRRCGPGSGTSSAVPFRRSFFGLDIRRKKVLPHRDVKWKMSSSTPDRRGGLTSQCS